MSKVLHKKHRYHFLSFLVIVLGFLFLLGLIGFKLTRPRTLTLFHGPHLSQTLFTNGINEAVLGKKTQRFVSTPPPTPTPLRQGYAGQAPSPTPTPLPTVSLNSDQFGIAAGGGLPYLGQSDLDLYFQQLKDLGVSWVRYDFDWGAIQANDSANFDWSGIDRVVQTASKYGIKTLGIITYTPAWARLSACADEFACAPVDPNAFGLFAGQVASRYAPQGIHDWEIWNEPNYHFFWKPNPDINAYIAILKSAYAEIKKADPSAVVLSGGLASAGDEDNNIAPITFIRSLYEIDTTKDFDAIAIHPYTYPVVASYPASWNNWQQIFAIRQLMIDHNDSQKLLWITEYGAPTNGPGSAHETTQLENFVYGSDYMTESAQNTIADDMLQLVSPMRSWLGPVFWYSLKDGGTSRDTPENFFGLLRFDGSKKPAYDDFLSAIKNSK